VRGGLRFLPCAAVIALLKTKVNIIFNCVGKKYGFLPVGSGAQGRHAARNRK
jgi:hypothetical protein